MAEFVAYEKMHTSTNQMKGTLNVGGKFVVTEKLHGANFSFRTNGEFVACAKRRGPLELGEEFFGARSVQMRYSSAAIALYHWVACVKGEPLSEMTVYGELVGGIFPGIEIEDEKSHPAIQTGVYYCRHTEFVLFDVACKLKDGTRIYLAYDEELIAAAKQAGFHCVPILRVCKFTEAMEFPIAFTSTIHSTLFGLPPPAVPSNLCEGVVVKQQARLPANERVILKRKNGEFAEKRYDQVKLLKRDDGANFSVLQSCMWEADAMVTQARLDAAVSKHGPVSPTLAKTLLQEMLQDICEELNSEGYASQLTSLEMQQVRKRIVPSIKTLIEQTYYSARTETKRETRRQDKRGDL